MAPAIGESAVAIEHIGSTAVDGLASKPIIDIESVVPSAAVAPIAAQRLSTRGYVRLGDLGIPGREAFTAPPQLPRHHLYVCPRDSEALHRHLAFRDYLRAHADEARRYGALKRRLAAQFHADREAYTEAKTAYIESVMEKARHST